MALSWALELLECCDSCTLLDGKSWDGHRHHLTAVGPPFVPAQGALHRPAEIVNPAWMGPVLPQHSLRNFPAQSWGSAVEKGSGLEQLMLSTGTASPECKTSTWPHSGVYFGVLQLSFSCQCFEQIPQGLGILPCAPMALHYWGGSFVHPKKPQAQAGGPRDPALEGGRGEAGAGRIY